MSLELLFNCERDRLHGVEDALICALHCFLIKKGLKCIGNGEEVKDNARASDMLPSGWNTSSDIYVMTYREEKTSDTFLFKVLNVDGFFFIQLLRNRDEKASDMEIPSSEFTTGTYTDFDTTYRQLPELETRFNSELFAPFQCKSTVGESRAKEPVADPLRNYRDRDLHAVRDPLAANLRDERVYNPLPMLGRNDLDPLRAGSLDGGGMYFDPLRYGGGQRGRQPDFSGPSMLPRGAVPPFARFDPIHPDMGIGGGFGVGGRRAGPDPDHLPPPGYNDMFM